MKFKRYPKPELGLTQFTIIPLVNVFFLLLFFFLLTSSFALPASIHVTLPKTITSDVITENNIVITITGENIIYLSNKIVTISELTQQLSQSSNKSRPILIKADRRSSVGRIVDVWGLCRNLGIEKINIATSQGK